MAEIGQSRRLGRRDGGSGLRYLILGLPRSRTTWLSAFLSLDGRFCLHDPLAFCQTHTDVKMLAADGMADTALGYFPDFVNAWDITKIRIRRPLNDVYRAMMAVNLPCLHLRELDNRLNQITFHVEHDFHDLNNHLEDLWTLVHPDRPFDEQRRQMIHYTITEERRNPVNPFGIMKEAGLCPY